MKKGMKRRFAAKLWTIARFILQAAKHDAIGAELKAIRQKRMRA